MWRLHHSFPDEHLSKMTGSNQSPSPERLSNSPSSASLSSIPLTSTSNSCPRCSDKLYLPPPTEALQSVFPSVDPTSLNRSIPRCLQCDKVNAERAAYFAKFPPPTHVDPVAELESHILKMVDLIALGVQIDGLKIALDVAIKQKGDKETERDKENKRIWAEFWGVWGPRD